MYLEADNITIESDEMGFELHIEGDFGPVDPLVINIQSIDLDAFYDQVKARIGPYLREAAEARTAVSRGVSLKEYLADEYRHEVSTGQHAPFLCADEDIDESGGVAENSYDRDEAYDEDDPKRKDWHSIHADIWDSRAGK